MTDRSCVIRFPQTRHRPGAGARAQSGFSLFEILTVIAIVALTATLAVPSLLDAVGNARITAATNTLVSTLNFARSEAIKRNFDVALCAAPGAASDNVPDQTLCSDNAPWESGFMVMTGVEQNDETVPSAYQPIRVINEFDVVVLQNGVTLTNQPISFDGQGRLRSRQVARFSVCDGRGVEFARLVTVNTSGMVEVANFPATSVDCSFPPL